MKRFSVLTLLVVLSVAGLALYQSFFARRLGGPAFVQLPPQTQEQRRVDAQKLVEKVKKIASDKPQNGAPKTFVIEASEEQLNTLLQDRLRTEKFPISDLRLGLSDGLLELQGNAKYGGIEWPTTISGTLEAQNGALHYQIQSLTVTGLPTPSELRAKAQAAIESGLQKAFSAQKSTRIDAIEITSGKLTVRGQTK